MIAEDMRPSLDDEMTESLNVAIPLVPRRAQ